MCRPKTLCVVEREARLVEGPINSSQLFSRVFLFFASRVVEQA
jgi:hypothetical protein